MRNMSIIMLVLALFLGTLTVFFAQSVISSLRNTRDINSTELIETEKVSVVIAIVPMKFGDELTAEKLAIKEWPADIKPEGSFESIEEILGSERRVVLRSISRRDPIVKDKISGFGSRASLSQVINEGHRAAAIRVNDVLSVGGFILPGDRVDVLHTYQNGKERIDSITNIIIEDVRVLAVDQISDESQEEVVVGKSVTLEITPVQAQKIALASNVGNLSLALRRMAMDDEEALLQSRTIAVRDLRPVKDGLLKPVGKPAVRSVTVPKVQSARFGDMKVTRGTELSQTKVPLEFELGREISTNQYPTMAGLIPSP